MIALKKILVATDFGEAADVALDYGRALAKQFGAVLDVVHVVDDSFSMYGAEGYLATAPELRENLIDAAREQLAALLIDSDNSGPPTVPVVLTSPSPAATIVGYAREHGVDLIVMGTHGRGALAHLIMGTVAERVVRLAPCPVLTVRHPEHEFVRPDALVAAAVSGQKAS